MRRGHIILFLSVMLCTVLSFSTVTAEFFFSDERFRGDFSTENLDAIIEEYDLYDGWYWTTPCNIPQTFHGYPESPGWTTSVEEHQGKSYIKGLYGCRWPVEHVRKTAPEQGGYAECFAFAQFIGYLLSGEINPQGNWDFFYSLEDSGGLRVGDIVRVEYKKNGRDVHHSAVVYAINGEEILFLQVSGSNYNRISVGAGFSDGIVESLTSAEEISRIPGLKISRFADR